MAPLMNETAMAAWDAVEASLEALKAPIDAEIRAYPLPIPGCDAQYNYLLERRGEIAREMVRLTQARADGGNDEMPVEDFLATCSVLDDGQKASIRRMLDQAVRKAG